MSAVIKPVYTLQDSVLIHLSQPLTQVTVRWDGNAISITQRGPDTVSVKATLPKTGLHQVIVSGVMTNKQPISDTLSVELWSDMVPADIHYAVLKTYPHEVNSFTQGLEFYQGNLYEGTGLNGQSKLMTVDLQTGRPLKSVALPEQYFGEGITIVNSKIYQLTWISGLCFQYSMNLSLEKTYTYVTQGWGLTHRDTTLILSDGSNKLYFYTPDFQKKAELSVYDNTGPITNLNELEYINGYVFANIWQTNRIAQIDLASGKVVGYLNMDDIVPPGIDSKENVLNGIAHQAGENALYITGKNWPTLFKIQLSSASADSHLQ